MIVEKVKGILLIPWVKVIRADKKGTFEKWLTDEDRQILSRTVLASSWYPLSTYQNIFTAVSVVVAKDSEEVLFKWGYDASVELLTGAYKNIIVKGSPTKSLKKYLIIRELFSNTGKIEVEVKGEKSAILSLGGYPSDFKYLYWLIRGWCTRLLEYASAKQVQSKFLNRSWEGAPNVTIEYTWS